MDRIPLHVDVCNKIKSGIESGAIRPNSDGLLPSQQAFAEEYKVSLTTISKAISELEDVGLVISRRGKGLILRSPGAARVEPGDVEKRVLHIGVAFFDVLNDVNNHFLRRAMMGIQAFCQEHNMMVHTLSFPAPDVTIGLDAFFASFPFANLDGILLLSPISTRSIAYIIEKGIPYASLNLLSDQDAVCCVGDTFEAGLKLTDAVLKWRHSLPVLVAGDRDKLSSHTFLWGYRMALEKHGLNYDPDYVCESLYDMDAVMSSIRALMDRGVKIESIIAHDDVAAAKLHDLLLAEGYSDILFAGTGNAEDYADKVGITVDPDLKTIGYDLTQSLFSLIHGITLVGKKRYYQTCIVEREWLRDGRMSAKQLSGI